MRAAAGSAAPILVVGPAWVGDMVMAQSLFKRLARAQPGAPIDVVAPPWSLPLLDRMPEVRAAHALDVPHGRLGWGARRALGRRLRAAGYGWAIVLPRSFKSALVPAFARIPRRTGYRGELRRLLLTDPRVLSPALDQTVKRFVALALPPGRLPTAADIEPPRLRVDPDNQARLLETLDLALDRPVVALLPGAEYGPAKQWPVGHFAALAGRLLARGRRVWVLGSAKERELGEAIAAGRRDVVNLCGRTRLTDAVDLLACAEAAVSNDSGLMHVAAALDRPLVAVYGSSSPAYTPPLSERAVILQRGLSCSPCFARRCRYGHYRCLTEIEVDQVLAALPA
ncbi:MAG: heptosyltransferase II [Gammaproteobacteria bacterium]|nr:MAG: heptosyltransferase II [Gammaproteobacteria bacterium]